MPLRVTAWSLNGNKYVVGEKVQRGLIAVNQLTPVTEMSMAVGSCCFRVC